MEKLIQFRIISHRPWSALIKIYGYHTAILGGLEDSLDVWEYIFK